MVLCSGEINFTRFARKKQVPIDPKEINTDANIFVMLVNDRGKGNLFNFVGYGL